MATVKEPYNNPYGTWKVTTEGDCEGRAVTDLGTYTGYIDEIALYLANQCYYSLRFSAAKPYKVGIATEDSVDVKLDIDSGTWSGSGSSEEVARAMQQVFKDRPVTIKPGCYFASFVIESKNVDENKRQRALAKLTDEEKALLGL